MISLSPLLKDLWTDLQSPTVLWQVAVIVACVFAARWLERVTLERWRRDRAAALAAQMALTGEAQGPGEEADATEVKDGPDVDAPPVEPTEGGDLFPGDGQ